MRQRLSPADNRRAWLLAALIVLMMLLAAVGLLRFGTEQDEAASLPAPGEALLAAAAGLDEIRIDAVFDPDAARLTVTQAMSLTNRTGQIQPGVMLRSWSGAYHRADTSPAATDELFADCYGTAFSPGGLSLTAAAAGNEPLAWQWLDDARTVLHLPCPWAADETLALTLTYTVQIPACASRFGYAEGVYMLGNVFPLPAVWQEGAWRTDAYAPIGDPFLSECANWQLTLHLPGGYTAAASAAAQQAAPGTLFFEGWALRDFALVISRNFVTVQGMAGDTLVTACARDRRDAGAMLTIAREALEVYEARWGDYAYPSLTLAEAAFPYGGMEYPGMVMIAADAVTLGGETLEITVAHEVAHQWWSVMAGSDSWYQPWQDEALCEYAVLDYMGEKYGAARRERMAFDLIETSLRITVPRGVTPGSPIDRFGNLTEYSLVVYQRGAALWRALETHLGKDALDALLRDYQSRFRFRIASRADLEDLISRHAGTDMSGLIADYLDTYMK